MKWRRAVNLVRTNHTWLNGGLIHLTPSSVGVDTWEVLPRLAGKSFRAWLGKRRTPAKDHNVSYKKAEAREGPSSDSFRSS